MSIEIEKKNVGICMDTNMVMDSNIDMEVGINMDNGLSMGIIIDVKIDLYAQA